MKQLNFNNQKEVLTTDDINQLVHIICHRCRVKTYTRVRSILTYGKGTIRPYGILDRLIKEDGIWFYCAGQSYPDEIRTIRNLIIKG